ncbi:MAG: hypothetical protein MZW92_17895 [Comamonadaceae bacterium]|nr:hypothetical protein [Comamonadaceae bacterium]
MPAGVIKILNGVNAGRELSLSKTLTTLGKPGVQVAVIRAGRGLLSHPRRRCPLADRERTTARRPGPPPPGSRRDRGRRSEDGVLPAEDDAASGTAILESPSGP